MFGPHHRPRFHGLDTACRTLGDFTLVIIRALVVVVLVLPLTVFRWAFATEGVSFVVLGDMPYDGSMQAQAFAEIGETIRRRNFPFVIHYGDIKGGTESCADPFLRPWLAAALELLPGRVIYTPGDNDWTDCDRKSAGSFDELERLAQLRRWIGERPAPAGPGWQVLRQTPDYPENARWSFGGLQFVTLHIVGTSNGRRQIKNPGMGKKAGKAHKKRVRRAVNARDSANLAWLAAAFDDAGASRKGLVVVIHSDVTDLKREESGARACGGKRLKDCHPYVLFLRELARRTSEFDRPVLLVHGSTNPYCLDRRKGRKATKLWRLNGPGDGVLDAAVVRFDASAREPFEVESLLGNEKPARCENRLEIP